MVRVTENRSALKEFLPLPNVLVALPSDVAVTVLEAFHMLTATFA
jgi:hypothetical protein